MSLSNSWLFPKLLPHKSTLLHQKETLEAVQYAFHEWHLCIYFLLRNTACAVICLSTTCINRTIHVVDVSTISIAMLTRDDLCCRFHFLGQLQSSSTSTAAQPLNCMARNCWARVNSVDELRSHYANLHVSFGVPSSRDRRCTSLSRRQLTAQIARARAFVITNAREQVLLFL